MMKSYLNLIPISARVHRKQNRLTLICIILAVFLVTAIFSIADLWASLEKDELIKRHGDYHIILSNVPENEAELISMRSDVEISAEYLGAADDPLKEMGYKLNGKNLVVYGANKSYIYDIRKFDCEGAYPQDGGEVMLSMRAKELFGISVGDVITLNMPSGGRKYTVSGFCADDEEYNDIIEGVCAYTNTEEFGSICAANGKNVTMQYYIRFGKHVRMRKAIADIKAQYNLTDENVQENMMVLGMSGASTAQQMTGLYPIAIALFLLILIAGVLMISSCMNSNVSQRTKFFGMLRCIGAGRKQIIRFVRLEALNWCKIAVPTGCGLGILSTWILCLILNNLVDSEFSGISFRISIMGIVCGIAVGVITVLIAAHSPAKRAAKVSPVTAVSGNDDIKNVSRAANTRIFKVETALGVNHAVSAKKNLILMTMSFAFTIILFFTFFACLDFAKALIPSASNFTSDFSIVSRDNENSMDKSIIDEIKQIPGVESVFGTMYNVGYPAKINGNEGKIDFISYDNTMLDMSKKSVVSGDLSKVYGNSEYALTIFKEGSRLDVGDKVMIDGVELEIACVLSEGIGGGGNAMVVCSEETYTRISGENKFMLISVMLSKNAPERIEDKIISAAGDNEVADRRDENKMNYNSYWLFRVAAYGFLAIIALIMILNIMNSISMSVSARIKQYGTMRAVGMSVKQLVKMITAETVTYALCGIAVGYSCGLYFHYLITKKLILEHFGGSWSIPIAPLVTVLAIVILACIAAIHSPSGRIEEMSVTETIHAQ